MKIAYIGKIQLSDVDLSYIHEAQKQMDITYIMEITPRFTKGPAFNIPKVYPVTGVFKAIDIYPEFKKYEGYIDMDKFYVVNTSGFMWQLKAIWSNILLVYFLFRHHFTTIHVAWPPNVYEFVIYLFKSRMLLTVHDPFPHSGLDTFIVRMRRKVAFHLIPKLILLNRTQYDAFIDYYHINPNRVIKSSLSRYDYLSCVNKDMTTVPSASRYLLFAGKVSPYKGLDYLLPAMEIVHSQCPDAKIIVAGNGNYHFDISRYKQMDYIEIRNRFIPDEELVALIENAAFLVCPYTDATQSGVVMSAFAFAKPVLVTNVGALPETVKHNEYGLVVKERDTKALADGIIQLWTNPDTLNAMSANIQSTYSSGEYSWKQITQHLCTEYK